MEPVRLDLGCVHRGLQRRDGREYLRVDANGTPRARFPCAVQISRNHHTVPQLYLRAFSDGARLAVRRRSDRPTTVGVRRATA